MAPANETWIGGTPNTVPRFKKKPSFDVSGIIRSNSRSGRTDGLKMNEPKLAFSPGDAVQWTKADADIPAGTVGAVLRLRDDGKYIVRFEGKNYSFLGQSLRKYVPEPRPPLGAMKAQTESKHPALGKPKPRTTPVSTGEAKAPPAAVSAPAPAPAPAPAAKQSSAVKKSSIAQRMAAVAAAEPKQPTSRRGNGGALAWCLLAAALCALAVYAYHQVQTGQLVLGEAEVFEFLEGGGVANGAAKVAAEAKAAAGAAGKVLRKCGPVGKIFRKSCKKVMVVAIN